MLSEQIDPVIPHDQPILNTLCLRGARIDFTTLDRGLDVVFHSCGGSIAVDLVSHTITSPAFRELGDQEFTVKFHNR